MSDNRIVTDQNGIQYEIKQLLGRGGQGAVYAVKGDRLAVKLVVNRDDVHRDRLRNQLMHVRRLPLQDMSLAKPLEMLRPPHTGYLMEMLADMAPIKSLISPPKGEPASPAWYISSGGLRRRLHLLAKAAHTLSCLHGKGLAYSDPSPGNIFVSSDNSASEVWFIDTDNLRYESDQQTAHNVFTPGYGAPELVLGRSGVTSLTDAHALAVIAFQALTLVHPFIGDWVSDGAPELEEQAFAGEIPWVEDPDDDRNRASFGVPREWVLSPRLVELFHSALGKGRKDPASRPGCAELADRLYAAADSTISCPACESSFYFNSKNCPWCDAKRPEFAMMVFKLWDPAIGDDGGIVKTPAKRPLRVAHTVVNDGQTIYVTRRLAYGQAGKGADDRILAVKLKDGEIFIKSEGEQSYPLLSQTGSRQSEVSQQPKRFKLEERQSSWDLHFGPSDDLHRVMSFEFQRGQA
jgi:DNA-binding helix-hairpin-helix protein with protein kinase domain